MSEQPKQINEFLKAIPDDASDIRRLHDRVGQGGTTQTEPSIVEGGAQDSGQTLEMRIAAMWESMMHRDGIDKDIDFFELGGDSILAVQILSKMRAELNVKLSLAEMLDGKLSVNELAAKIAAHHRQ